MSPARVAPGSVRGAIVPIGGAEDKLRDAAILRRFTELAGGRRARIMVIPTASEIADTGARYEAVFRSLGAEARALPLDRREDCQRPEWLEALSTATGVFLAGGNQLRLSTTLGGTAVATRIRRLNADGVAVAGTSAGAAFLSEHMIAFGAEGATPRGDMVTLAPGLGLTNRVIVDQHFRQRDRLGRLLTALAYNPFAQGLGLDEDTAAFIAPDDRLEVVGTGAVTVVDPSELDYSSMGEVTAQEPVCLIGVKLHVLVHGATYDLGRRLAAPPSVPPSRAREAAT
jgi:cyanophycinase